MAQYRLQTFLSNFVCSLPLYTASASVCAERLLVQKEELMMRLLDERREEKKEFG